MQEITIKITIIGTNEDVKTNALLIEDAIIYNNNLNYDELETTIINTKES